MAKPSRRSIAREVRQLKARPGWDPSKRVSQSAEETLEALDQEVRNAQVYASEEECLACLKERSDSGDASALCAAHLAEAMGF